MCPSVNGYFFIPTFGSLIAAINFDLSGTTKIGKDALNHSVMIRGVVATAVTVATGLFLARIMFGETPAPSATRTRPVRRTAVEGKNCLAGRTRPQAASRSACTSNT